MTIPTGIGIRFEGICTHITYPYPPECLPHRVVLAKAYDGYPEHYARLIIPVSAILDEAEVSPFAAAAASQKGWEKLAGNYYFSLEGVTLSIDNPCPQQGYRQEQSFLCGIPRLSVVARKWLGEPDASVTHARDITKALAYFDVSAGTWTAGIRYGGAVVAVLDCLTEGEPVLCAEAFAGSTPASLRVKTGTTLTVLYTASENQDGDDDFGIQFRVVDPDLRPSGRDFSPAGPPCRIAVLPDLPTPFEPPSIGPGCSNSLFP